MRRWCVLLLLLIPITGCKSINIPFIHTKADYAVLPADALREVAAEIEKAVQEGNRELEIADRAGIVLDDDLVKQAIRTRAARSKLIDEFLSTGHLIEDRHGLVSIQRTGEYKKSTNGPRRDRDALLVMGENADRWALYEGIIRTSKLAPRSLSAVQEIFHEARVATMKEGQKYEDANGTEVVKGR